MNGYMNGVSIALIILHDHDNHNKITNINEIIQPPQWYPLTITTTSTIIMIIIIQKQQPANEWIAHNNDQ